MSMFAKVWNDDEKPYSEKFRDDLITIPNKHYIIMDKNDAVQFMGQFIPIKKDGMGNYLNAKKLRIEMIDKATADQAQQFLCMACNRQHTTKQELELHIEANHVEQILDDEIRDQIKKKAK